MWLDTIHNELQMSVNEMNPEIVDSNLLLTVLLCMIISNDLILAINLSMVLPIRF